MAKLLRKAPGNHYYQHEKDTYSLTTLTGCTLISVYPVESSSDGGGGQGSSSSTRYFASESDRAQYMQDRNPHGDSYYLKDSFQVLETEDGCTWVLNEFQTYFNSAKRQYGIEQEEIAKQQQAEKDELTRLLAQQRANDARIHELRGAIFQVKNK